MPVIDVSYERIDVYYDLHVPSEEHYLADGIWSHNTGKSMACLFRLHLACLQEANRGLRCLVVRKTMKSLGATTLVTFRERVAKEALNRGICHYFGGNVEEAAAYRYPATDAAIVVGGMDNPTKIMSGEYDLIFCLDGDTEVDSPSSIEKGYRRPYSGPIVTIRTAAGHQLTGTPNHPVLTDQGWVALGSLDVGSYVVSRGVGEQERTRTDPDVEDRPPAIREVVRALALANPGGAKRVVAVPMDFHGDGGHGQIDVVTAGGFFEDGGDAALIEHLLEVEGHGRDLEHASGVRGSSPVELVNGAGFPRIERPLGLAELAHALAVFRGARPLRPTSLGGFSSLPLPLRVASEAQGSGLSASAGPHPPGSHLSLEPRDADAQALGDGHEPPFSGEVSLDRVVELVRREAPPGWHAYNLQTQHGWYLANNIVTHNCDEATELTQDDWEHLSTRLRHGVLSWQQLIGACNPSHPTHWLKQLADAGALRMLESRHEDNPTLYRDGEQTAEGERYIGQILDNLTGVRYLRLRKGIWAAAEGVIYEEWDPAIHLLDPFPIPDSWTRWWAVDFGHTNPMVVQCWAEDEDGRLYMYREFYKTRMLVEDVARVMLQAVTDSDGVWTEPRPRAVVCDHDAEGRATLERHLGMSTVPAHKAVTEGIQAVQARLRQTRDGRPRLFLFRDALMDRDPELERSLEPQGAVEEITSYVWLPPKDGRPPKEEPLKEHDHSMDALRYLVAEQDLGARPGVRWL